MLCAPVLLKVHSFLSGLEMSCISLPAFLGGKKKVLPCFLHFTVNVCWLFKVNFIPLCRRKSIFLTAHRTFSPTGLSESRTRFVPDFLQRSNKYLGISSSSQSLTPSLSLLPEEAYFEVSPSRPVDETLSDFLLVFNKQVLPPYEWN